MIGFALANADEMVVKYQYPTGYEHKEPLTQIGPVLVAHAVRWGKYIGESLDPLRDSYASASSIAMMRYIPVASSLDPNDEAGIKRNEYSLRTTLDLSISPVIMQQLRSFDDGTSAVEDLRVVNGGHVSMNLSHNRGNYIELPDGTQLEEAHFDLSIFPSSGLVGYTYRIDFWFDTVVGRHILAKLIVRDKLIDVDDSDLLMPNPPVTTPLFIGAADLFHASILKIPARRVLIEA